MSASVSHLHRLLASRQLVLVERQAAVDGPLPQADVVLLAAGEVDQGEREHVVGDDAQVGVHHDLAGHRRSCRRRCSTWCRRGR